MTLVLKLDLNIVKLDMYTKMKLLALKVQKLQTEQIHRQTDRQTDTHTHTHTDSTEIITYPHARMVSINWHPLPRLKYPLRLRNP